MDFRLLNTAERHQLIKSLRSNVESNEPIFMGRDTSYNPNEAPESNVVDAVRSVPTHY